MSEEGGLGDCLALLVLPDCEREPADLGSGSGSLFRRPWKIDENDTAGRPSWSSTSSEEFGVPENDHELQLCNYKQDSDLVYEEMSQMDFPRSRLCHDPPRSLLRKK